VKEVWSSEVEKSDPALGPHFLEDRLVEWRPLCGCGGAECGRLGTSCGDVDLMPICPGSHTSHWKVRTWLWDG
jgi:hypothetical protein